MTKAKRRMSPKNQAASLLREIKRRQSTPAEIERRERALTERREHEQRLKVAFEAPIREDERRKVAEEIARALEAKAGHRCPECGGKPGSVKHAPGAGWGSAATSRCGAGHTWRGPNHHIAVHAAAEIARTFGGAS